MRDQCSFFAALLLFHFAENRAESKALRSSSERLGLASIIALRLPGKCSGLIWQGTSPSSSHSTVFFSSRILPGQSYCIRHCKDSSENSGTGDPECWRKLLQ